MDLNWDENIRTRVVDENVNSWFIFIDLIGALSDRLQAG